MEHFKSNLEDEVINKQKKEIKNQGITKTDLTSYLSDIVWDGRSFMTAHFKGHWENEENPEIDMWH